MADAPDAPGSRPLPALQPQHKDSAEQGTPPPPPPIASEADRQAADATTTGAGSGTTPALEPNFVRDFRFWAVIAGLSVTILLSSLENTVVTTAAPVILTDLDLGADFVWVTNSFFVCSAAFQPLFGQLCNAFGRRWVTILIVSLFALGSGIAGGATSGAMLIGGRAVQGIGSGGVVMVIDIIISDLVPLRQRGNYMAVVLSLYTIGSTLGPFIGGAIVSSTTWRWVFYINLPIAGASLIVLYLFLHVNYKRDVSLTARLRRIDVIGNGILMASTLAVLYALTYAGGLYAWSSWHTLVPLIIGLAGFALFALWETHGWAPDPVMPPRLFTNRTSAVVSITTFIMSILIYWALFFLPVYFQSVALYSPRRTGVALLPSTLLASPGAAVSAIALSRWGKFVPLHVAGFALLATGIGLFALLREDSTIGDWVGFQFVSAVGLGMVLNTLLPAFQAPVPESDQAVATASWNFIRTFGQVWGVAIPAAVFNNRIDGLLADGAVSDPALASLLAGGGAYQRASAAFIEQLPLQAQTEVRALYRQALQRVFEISAALGALAFLLSFLEREVSLRTELTTEFGLTDAGAGGKGVVNGSGRSAEEGLVVSTPEDGGSEEKAK